jgi:hypothetical protein
MLQQISLLIEIGQASRMVRRRGDDFASRAVEDPRVMKKQVTQKARRECSYMRV